MARCAEFAFKEYFSTTKGALIGASFAVKTCQNLSFAVTSDLNNLLLQVSDNEVVCHDLSLPVKGGRMEPAVGLEPTTC
jgi:hypothetical protein